MINALHSCSLFYRKDMLDSASRVASDISNAISAQKEELDDRKRSVNMLQKALVRLPSFCYCHQFTAVKKKNIL